jgi:hypothetical protein
LIILFNVRLLEFEKENPMEKTPVTLGPVAQSRAIFTANAALPIEERQNRKQLIEACVAAGINKATATTQHDKFHHAEGSTKARTGAVAAVKAIIAEHYGQKTRKEIITLAEEAGFNKATASTQYGKYHQVASKLEPVVEKEPVVEPEKEPVVEPKKKSKGKAKA